MTGLATGLRDVCVFGAGAVGGNVAVHLIAHTSSRVSVVARGAHLDAIRSRGLRLRRRGDGELFVRPRHATDNPQELGRQDLVIVALKAPTLPAAAEAIAGLLGPDSVAVFLTNGVPWWWNYGVGTMAVPVESLDPGGLLRSLVRPDRVLGGLVRSSNEVIEPGVIMHTGDNSWLLGEPTGKLTKRLQAAAALFAEAGLRAEPTSRIHQEVWSKLLANVSSAPVATLTRLYSSDVRATSELEQVQRQLWDECAAIGRSLGIPVEGTFDDAPVPPPARRPSMLQDVLAQRPTEVEAILGVPQALARMRGVPTPTLDVVVALLRGLDRATSSRTAR